MYQQIILIGNLGNDPEQRFTPSGTPVTNFSLAVNKVWTDANGDRQEKVTWFECSSWQKQAEIAKTYLSKGKRVLVIGEIEDPRTWIDKETGKPKATNRVRVTQIKFLSGDREHLGEGDLTSFIPGSTVREKRHPLGDGSLDDFAAGSPLGEGDIPF